MHHCHLASTNANLFCGHQHFVDCNEGIENALHCGVEVAEAEVVYIVGPIVLITIESDGRPARGIPLRRQHAGGKVEGEVPVVGIDGVKTLVVHGSQQLCFCRLSLGVGHLQCPCLFLSGHEFIAESLPRQMELLVGLGTGEHIIVGVAFAVLDPGQSQCESIAVLRFVLNLFGLHLIAECGLSLLDDLVRSKDGVEDMDILVGTTYLKIDGTAHGELAGGEIVPVVCGSGRMTVGIGKHDDVAAQRVALADRFQMVLAGCEFPIYINRCVCLNGCPVTVVEAVADVGLDALAIHILAREEEGLQAVAQTLLGQCAGKNGGAVGQRHHRCGLLRLTREAGDFRLGSDAIAESLVEIDVIGVGHRQFDGKRTVVGSDCGVGQKSLLTDYSAIPPQHRTTANRVDDLTTLYGYAGISLCHTAHAERVTGLVGLSVFVEVDLEGRTLVLFHMYRGVAHRRVVAAGH